MWEAEFASLQVREAEFASLQVREAVLITAPRVYLGVLLTLLALTVLTILVSYLDLGPFSTPIAFVIAATKALLVVLFFMHLKDAPGILWLAFSAGFFWLAILVVLTMSDFATRGLLPIPGK